MVETISETSLLQAQVAVLETGLDKVLSILREKHNLQNLGDARLVGIIEEAESAAYAAKSSKNQSGS